MITALDDRAWRADVEPAAGGDKDAYARLVHAHRHLVSAVALAIVRDVATSEDVAQEVFVHAWRGLKTVKNPDSFRAWVRALARNCAYQAVRGRGRRTAVVAEAAPDLLALAADPSADAAAQLEHAEDRVRLQTAIDALPEASREIVLLYYREGQSTAQVAQLLDLQEATVRQRLARAREALRQELLDQAGESARRTALGEGFASAVIAGLPAAGPAWGAALAGAGKVGLGFKLGALGGIGGVLTGLVMGLRRARSDAERWSVWVGSALCVGIVLGLVRLLEWTNATEEWGLGFLGYLGCVAAMLVINFGTLDRATRARRAQELAEDPTYWAPRHARDARWKWAGVIGGPVLGALPLLWMLVHHGWRGR